MRLRSLFQIGLALLLSLQMARGSADLLLCLHSDSAHVTAAHKTCCNENCSQPPAPSTESAFYSSCECTDIALPGQENALTVPSVPVSLIPAIPVLSSFAEYHPEPSTSILSSRFHLLLFASDIRPPLQDETRRSLELRI